MGYKSGRGGGVHVEGVHGSGISGMGTLVRAILFTGGSRAHSGASSHGSGEPYEPRSQASPEEKVDRKDLVYNGLTPEQFEALPVEQQISKVMRASERSQREVPGDAVPGKIREIVVPVDRWLEKIGERHPESGLKTMDEEERRTYAELVEKKLQVLKEPGSIAPSRETIEQNPEVMAALGVIGQTLAKPGNQIPTDASGNASSVYADRVLDAAENYIGYPNSNEQAAKELTAEIAKDKGKPYPNLGVIPEGGEGFVDGAVMLASAMKSAKGKLQR